MSKNSESWAKIYDDLGIAKHDFSKATFPINALYKKGFSSIGCSICTRAIKEGEDIRAGRWWWENPDHKECGLHRK